MAVAFDIETFCPVEELSEEELTYLRRRKEYWSEEDFQRELATNPYVSIIVACSFFFIEKGEAQVYYLSNHSQKVFQTKSIEGKNIKITYTPVPIKANTTDKSLLDAERKLLEYLWENLNKVDVLITFYGKDFDMEFVKIRTLIHGLEPEGFFINQRQNQLNHIDLKELFNVGSRRYSLNFISKRLGLPVSKGDMDGSNVREAFLNKEYTKIANYNLMDTIITGLLYKRVKRYLQEEYFAELLSSAGFNDGVELIEYALQKDLLSQREVSFLIDVFKQKTATPNQKAYLLDLIKSQSPNLSEVCSVLSYKTMLKIVKNRIISEEEIT